MNQKVVQSGLPVILWVHGGSFIAGSASDPALDGTSLAASTNSIVAVVQYRLGAVSRTAELVLLADPRTQLGFLPPISLNSNTNLGAKDVVTALKFISNVVSSFGGTPGLVTLAGQSSGATLIRGLLGAPSAQSYFKNAWLHSDPFDYGFNNPGAQQNLQSAFYGGVSCESSSKTCALAMSLQSIIASQNQVFLNGPSIDPSTGASMPIRVVHDGSFITSTLTQQSFPSSLKPIIVTTANKDAGPVIFGGAPPLPPSLYTDVLEGTFSDQDTQTLENSGFYNPPTDPDADIRPELVILGTDQVWRCPTWTMSRTWSSRGGTIFTGLWVLGATYPTNTGFDICTTPGNVCHQDDIEIVFGTVANPTPAQAALVQEVQARYGAFVRTSNPNPSGFAKWTASSPSNINAINLGSSGTAATGGCIPSLWGNQVLYYYQQFGQ
ncbi:alpha/beta-hydrolase [Sistotremastrum niveocremeum HHB9708]|uniref:Carboxylic ester hydrolase n=1 Tax=Sistotremastrum niveocremeum HHB9708 TaxID=1314777 RepID=A0A164QV64_9AGAM|nr:alpha/beta-hydrolase [Sistotremastrum niveocremeum HHB9708]